MIPYERWVSVSVFNLSVLVDTLGLLRRAGNDKIYYYSVIANVVKQSTAFVDTLRLLRGAGNDKIYYYSVIANVVKQSLAGNNHLEDYFARLRMTKNESW
ncbi:hypothetical protein [Kamptonema sp. UHCC 0994]|uniref:hypothetical protein n=1 Tax=Kamptonema sp. UHCC 0994 TaxID=3031329 RepID=UPI0023B969BF|nr:hypothetical protein [Kamptonema sp. UHCC 0994]MDF0552156.1 hypothetical protein [Kamptonema sp. UHCC 0994]